jgi:hypothetical protein
MLGLTAAILPADQAETEIVEDEVGEAKGVGLNLPKPSFPRRLG